MNQYSEIVGSFLRNGSFSLEANYTFPTEEELIQFYSIPENQAILHQGLFKVVGEGEQQSLYWIVKTGEELKFKKFLENADRETVQGWLEEIQKKLQEGEIAINDLQEDIKELQDLIPKTNAIIGSEEDWKEYLNTLDFSSITAISEYLTQLKQFLDGTDIDTKLDDILQNLYNSIKEDTNTGIEVVRRSLLDLIESLQNRCYNLQTELDQTQVGVGLSGDGAYNADKETYYLRNATSVMNALKTLDGLLHRYTNVEYADTDTIHFDSKTLEDENIHQVSADVKIAKDSDIIIKDNNGIYHKVNLKNENGQITLYVNGEVRDSFNIGIDPLLEDGYYDEHTEKLILIFKLHNSQVQRVEIPVDKLITEWETGDTLSITLNRTRVVDGPDVLTANLNVSSDKDNGITIKENGVYTSKNAKDLVYKEGTVEKAIEDLQTEVEETQSALEKEVQRATSKEEELERKITDEVTRAEEFESRISELEDLETRVGAIEDDYLKASDKTELEGKITAEKDRAEGEESRLGGLITAETNRASTKEQELDSSITEINNRLDTFQDILDWYEG